MGISTANFLLPNQLSTGGFAGISTIVYYLFKFPAGNVLIALNVPLLLVAFFRINKGLFFKISLIVIHIPSLIKHFMAIIA